MGVDDQSKDVGDGLDGSPLRPVIQRKEESCGESLNSNWTIMPNQLRLR